MRPLRNKMCMIYRWADKFKQRKKSSKNTFIVALLSLWGLIACYRKRENITNLKPSSNRKKLERGKLASYITLSIPT